MLVRSHLAHNTQNTIYFLPYSLVQELAHSFGGLYEQVTHRKRTKCETIHPQKIAQYLSCVMFLLNTRGSGSYRETFFQIFIFHFFVILVWKLNLLLERSTKVKQYFFL